MLFRGDIDYIWTLSTRVSSPGFGLLVWDILVVLTLVSLTTNNFISSRGKPQFPEHRIVLAGLVFLSAYYILHVIDLAVHVSEAVVRYGYLIVPVVFSIPRTISDLLILLGSCEIHLKYFQTRPHKHNIRWLWAISSLFAAAHTCMLFGLVICWMSLVDGDATERIASWRSALEVGSATLSFMIALGLVTSEVLRTKSSHMLYNPRSNNQKLFSAALLPLFIRTFCEVVIVGEYDRNRFGINLDSASKARDVCHGLFSIVFAICISEFFDPGERDRVESIRQEVEAKTESVVTERLITMTARGSRTAPQVADFLEQLRQNVPKVSEQQDLETRLRSELSLDYLDRLSARYNGWVPIQRWPGATPKP